MPGLEEIDRVIERIQAMESDKKALAALLKGFPNLTWKIKKAELGDMLIGGEDGGITKKSTHLIDFIFLRAVSVLFKYRGGELENVDYFPSMSPPTEVAHTSEPLSEPEFRMFWSLRRIKKELEVSLRAIEKHSPDAFLIDGSLMVHPADVPRKESSLFEDYLEISHAQRELQELCRSKGCILAGIVEDSRSSLFSGYIERELLPLIGDPKAEKLKNMLKKVRDTNLLHYLLEKGEATLEMECEGEIKCIYMKTAEFDRPIRVEYMDNREKIAGIVYALSSQSRTYGLPNVLIEADQRAKLSESDSLYYMNHISSRLGLQDLFFLRRENRPF
jgi:hypothetical protein